MTSSGNNSPTLNEKPLASEKDKCRSSSSQRDVAFDEAGKKAADKTLRGKRTSTEVEQLIRLSAKLENPLAGLTKEQLVADAEVFCKQAGLMDHVEAFTRGAILAHDPANLSGVPNLTPEERALLEKEKMHRWRQPNMMSVLRLAILSQVTLSRYVLQWRPWCKAWTRLSSMARKYSTTISSGLLIRTTRPNLLSFKGLLTRPRTYAVCVGHVSVLLPA